MPLFTSRTSQDIYLVKKKLDAALLHNVGSAKDDPGRDQTHWALIVGEKYYHLDNNKGKVSLNNKRFAEADINWGPKMFGSTKRTEEEIKDTALKILELMNKKGGYTLLENNCQLFANQLFCYIDEKINPTGWISYTGCKDLFGYPTSVLEPLKRLLELSEMPVEERRRVQLHALLKK